MCCLLLDRTVVLYPQFRDYEPELHIVIVTNVVPLIYDLFDKFYFLIRRVRPPEKMQRNRELTAARRKEENVMISQLTSVIPLSDEQLRKADRTTLIRLAVHFIKVKELVSSKWH